MIDIDTLPADHPLRDPAFRLGWEQRMAKYAGQPVETPVIEPEPEIARKASDGLPHGGNPLEDEAIAYIHDYTGNFDFILDLRADRRWGTKWYRLSERQVDAVLRVKARDLAAKAERVQTGRDLTAILPVGRTHAAVVNEAGAVTFLIIDIPAENDKYGNPSRWAGWAFVKQFIGGIGEGQRLGSQRPGETYSGQWATLIDQVLDDPMGCVQRFGRELGICGICSLPLTNEESREFGIGPVCRKAIKS